MSHLNEPWYQQTDWQIVQDDWRRANERTGDPEDHIEIPVDTNVYLYNDYSRADLAGNPMVVCLCPEHAAREEGLVMIGKAADFEFCPECACEKEGYAV